MLTCPERILELCPGGGLSFALKLKFPIMIILSCLVPLRIPLVPQILVARNVVAHQVGGVAAESE